MRDRIPEIIRSKGAQPTVRTASEDELDLLMRTKIVEEAEELLSSSETEEIIDLLEVIDALIQLRGLNSIELDQLRAEKNQARGSFKRGYVLLLDDPERST
ncbi:MAG: nucleoside triphosphate pyrophosphohydrolase [Candidatus Thorarchaeota archaeon]